MTAESPFSCGTTHRGTEGKAEGALGYSTHGEGAGVCPVLFLSLVLTSTSDPSSRETQEGETKCKKPSVNSVSSSYHNLLKLPEFGNFISAEYGISFAVFVF